MKATHFTVSKETFPINSEESFVRLTNYHNNLTVFFGETQIGMGIDNHKRQKLLDEIVSINQRLKTLKTVA